MKRGFELSINFMVVMILAIVVFGLGIYFVKEIFSEANKVQERLDAQTEEQIRSLLHSGEKVVVSQSRISLRPGGSEAVGLGVLNVDDNSPLKEDVYINIVIGPKYDEAGKEVLDGKLVRDNIYFRIPKNTLIKIKQNKEEILSIGVSVPNEVKYLGTHILNIYVCLGGYNGFNPATEPCDESLATTKLYDETVHKIYVEVAP